MKLAALPLALALLAFATPSIAQRGPDDPEPVIRALVTAIYANDVAGYEKVTLPHPLRSRLTSGGRPNPSGLDELKQNPSSLQIRRERPFLFKGEEAKAGGNNRYPAGTTALYRVAHHGGPMVVGLVRQEDGWKVDLRWWIAMTELMSGRRVERDSPEFVVRSLLAAMLRMDRDAARRFIVPPVDVPLLFDGAPRQREPSGVLEATVGEMPLVEIEPGECYPTPTGKIVEGSKSADTKVLVGWFGPVEIPFVLRKAGKDWRVVAEPYFALMNQ